MGYEDNRTKVLGSARAGIREAESALYLIGKKIEETEPKIVKLRSKLAAEEQKLADLESEQFDAAQKKIALTGLVEQLRVRHDALPELSEEEFKDRYTGLLWEIADLTGTYAYIREETNE